jgi:hypothetical protein
MVTFLLQWSRCGLMISRKAKRGWLRIEKKVQECDATMKHSSNEAGSKKKLPAKYRSYFNK